MMGVPALAWMVAALGAPAGPVFIQEAGHVTWTLTAEKGAEGRHVVVGVRGGQRFTAEVGAEVLVQAADIRRVQDVEVVRNAARVPALWLVRSTRAEDAFRLAARLRADAAVEDVFPDLWLPHVRAAQPPDDTHYVDQWYFQQLSMPDAWELARGRETPTTVIIVDNGCDPDHPDLVAKLDTGLDVLDDDEDPRPTVGEAAANHGTACAGIVGASTHNMLGIAGACPHCRLRCVRLLSDSGLVPLSADVRAFQFALDVDAAVVSNSWGFQDAIPVPAMLATIIQRVRADGNGGRGAVVAFAMGNDGRPVGDDELMAVPGVLGVGAITRVGDLASFSNTGMAVDVVVQAGTFTTDISGPGGDNAGDYTSSFGGTSSACPVAAGVAALLFSARANLSADDVEAAIISTARQSPYANPDAETGHDLQFGFGVVNPLAAWRVLDPVPDAGTPDAASGSGGDAPGEVPEGCACDGAGGAPFAAAPAWMLSVFSVAFRRRRATRRPPGTGTGRSPHP